VFADLRALETLPEREWLQGWAELVKQAWIAGGTLWAEVASGPWTHAPFWVYDAAQVKLKVVAADPYERGSRRALLNMGHTVGHAVESMVLALELDYGHGDCVAKGLSVESRILDALGYPGSAERSVLRGRIANDFKFGDLQSFEAAAVWAAMEHDKKKRGGVLRMVWSPSPGAPEEVIEIEGSMFTSAWIADEAH
jgi:3-dehydroquinate synthase